MLSFLFKLFVIFFVFTLIGTGFVYLDYQKFLASPVGPTIDGSFTIQSGDSFNHVSASLKKEGVIKNDFYLKALAKLEFDVTKIKAGDYYIKSQTPRELLSDFIDGNVVTLSMSLPEGKTFRDFIKLISEHKEIEQTLEYVPDNEIMSIINSQFVFPEGLFAPDTYRFSKGTKDIDILKMAHEMQLKRMDKAWQSRSPYLPVKSQYELLILASMIEKETGKSEERSEIAGVFVRRLQKDMKLQTDPTVIYGMGNKYNGRLLYRHLKEDTPYNTYTRKGLTPTPISLPGQAALMAAAQPKTGKSLYFVADGKGGHIFSETYKEHLKAVKKYREQLKN